MCTTPESRAYPDTYSYPLRFAGTIGVGVSVGPPSFRIDTQKYRNGEPDHEGNKEEPVTDVTCQVSDQTDGQRSSKRRGLIHK